MLVVAHLQSYLQFVLLFQPKTPRIYWQLAVLSLGQVAIASTLVPGPMFAVHAAGVLVCGNLHVRAAAVAGRGAALQPSGRRAGAGSDGRNLRSDGSIGCSDWPQALDRVRAARRPLGAARATFCRRRLANRFRLRVYRGRSALLFFVLPRWDVRNREVASDRTAALRRIFQDRHAGRTGRGRQQSGPRDADCSSFEGENPGRSSSSTSRCSAARWSRAIEAALGRSRNRSGMRVHAGRVDDRRSCASGSPSSRWTWPRSVLRFSRVCLAARLLGCGSTPPAISCCARRTIATQQLDFEVGTNGIVNDRQRQIDALRPAATPIPRSIRLLQMPASPRRSGDPLAGTAHEAASARIARRRNRSDRPRGRGPCA